jgi:large subunit ribosomal protein L13
LTNKLIFNKINKAPVYDPGKIIRKELTMQKQSTVIKESELTHKWYIFDASTQPLGRLASQVAIVLMGKHKPSYAPNLDNGDFVIVINAAKAVLTGNKLKGKKYYTQVSQQPGGLRTRTAEVMLKDYPEEMIMHAVKGMLPKGSLGKQMAKKCHVYVDDQHPHAGQHPEVFVKVGK